MGVGDRRHRAHVMPDEDVYVIAVKRERRAEVPPDWIEIVRGTSGVTILGTASATLGVASAARLQIKASPDAIQRLNERLSEYLHIEKRIPHHLK